MLISVVIPTHQQKVLKETLTALSNQKGINQNQYEVIVVNNPRDNDTFNLVRGFGFKYVISQLGSNNARNAGIALAKAPIIALTDDDCLPNENWLSRLLGLHAVYNRCGVICGPLKLKYLCDQPKWLTDDLEYLLSRMEWNNPPGVIGPFDLNIYPNRWAVSANLSFTKANYLKTGGLNGNIGYHGKQEYISNDEIQFINKLSPYGIIYDNELVVEHLIAEDRCTIDFLELKSYGQGVADGIMQREESTDSINDIYHNYFQPKLLTMFDYNRILKTREKIANEDATREYIKAYIKVKLAYLAGLEKGLGGSQWIKQSS